MRAHVLAFFFFGGVSLSASNIAFENVMGEECILELNHWIRARMSEFFSGVGERIASSQAS